MDRAAIPVDFELRRIENIFFPENIREISGSDPPEEPSSASTTIPNSIVLEGKGVDEEALPPAKDKSPEDTLTIRGVVLRAKDAGPKPKAGDDCPEADGPAKSSTQDKA